MGHALVADDGLSPITNKYQIDVPRRANQPAQLQIRLKQACPSTETS